MSKRIQIIMFGTICLIVGWLAGHLGPGYGGAHANQTKAPTSLYGQVLRVRGAGEQSFTDKSKRFELEVYRDENNGNLIYVTDTGAISVVPSR